MSHNQGRKPMKLHSSEKSKNKIIFVNNNFKSIRISNKHYSVMNHLGSCQFPLFFILKIKQLME
jgi:hypothetical protein